MKIRRLLSLALACCLFVAISISAGAVEAPGVDYGVEGSLTAEEVYIEPVRIDENTYHYYDENGELLAVFFADPADGDPASPRATLYNISWEIDPNSIKHSTVDLDTTQGATDVYYKIFASYETTTYVGYYMSSADKYSWFNPPFTLTKSGSFLCATSHPINFALKNTGNRRNHYSGGFSLSPI